MFIYFQDVMDTPVGKLILSATDLGLISICFSDKQKTGRTELVGLSQHHPVLEKARLQMTEYFQGRRRSFDLALHPAGTPFQVEVWRRIAEIPWGETRSYQQIALSLGNKNKARAVGRAANRNPLPIVIPCHRVIGAQGELTGFGGGLERKAYLLKLEAGCHADLFRTPC